MTEILAVAQKGEGVLSLIAKPLSQEEMHSNWIKTFAHAMQVTMQERNGVGIAAPQVYLSKRIIIVASRPNLRYPDAPYMDEIVMLNPEILAQSEQTILGEEGCLSVPDERGNVARAENITVQYFTLEGEKVTQDFSGFPARIVQHEIDHLNGVLFVDRF